MKKEIILRIEISPRLIHGLLIAVLLAAWPAAVDSETVTLQTYYPAPYGIYTQLRAIGTTTIAESATGSFVAVGATSQSSGEKFRVVGASRLEGTTYSGGALTVAAGGATVTGAVSATTNVTAANYIYGAKASGCQTKGSNGTCPNGFYATYVAGVRTEGYWYAHNVKEKNLGSAVTYQFQVRSWDTNANAWGNNTWKEFKDAFDVSNDSWLCCDK